MKSLSRTVIALVMLVALQVGHADDKKISQATQFLKEACVTSGSSLELKVTANGELQVRRLLGSGVEGSVTLTKKELQGFADSASALSAQQATEMRNCMKPYIDKILNVILSQ
jgi:hypothetical protein